MIIKTDRPNLLFKDLPTPCVFVYKDKYYLKTNTLIAQNTITYNCISLSSGAFDSMGCNTIILFYSTEITLK